eukprot:TRINITY_DN1902_c0_g1_i1.p1 TRINITY_DN1902_c0_g1~~TRINITY_DN1902_c0_g1_i1.p1  ORF type:complete len:288 (-),score=61.17 TRINITY_DN1902_c0_g1_i1:223-1086(-)
MANEPRMTIHADMGDPSSGVEPDSPTFKRRGNQGISQAASSALVLRSAAMEVESDTDLSEDSSEDEDDEPQGAPRFEALGPLLQCLTTKWKNHSEKMVVQIIKGKADVHEELKEPWDSAFSSFKQTIGATPLHFAARMGLREVCKALLEHEAQVDAETKEGTTPLQVAVMFSHRHVIMDLLDAKASVIKTNPSGCCAVDLGLLEGDESIIRTLVEQQEREEEARFEKALEEAKETGVDISRVPRIDVKARRTSLELQALRDRLPQSPMKAKLLREKQQQSQALKSIF